VSGLWNPRWVETAPNGDVFVAESQPGRITILRPSGDGSAPQKFVFATGLTQPFGIAFYPQGPNPKYVYVGDTDEVVRFPYHNGDTAATGSSENIMALTPGGYNQHWTRTVIFSPDSKKMYVGVGSQTNVDNGEAPPRACVMEANPDGTDAHVYASGLRNAVGLTFNPVSGAIWAAVNERDNLGDKLPPDYVTSVKRGGFYGWPYMYIGNHKDPRIDTPPNLPSAIVPDVLLEAHCAALSIEFYNGKMFPKEYYHDGFVVMHGSWNRSDPSGYKVVRLKMNSDGTTANHGYQDFIWGWKPVNGNVWGRPVSLAFLKDGSMVVSDDGSNSIWRVTYSK
jgi:glucose/arabinose dehydrogenase